MHDTLYFVIGQRWLWGAALLAALVAAAASLALRRFAPPMGKAVRLLVTVLAAPLLFLVSACGLILLLAREPATDWSDLAWTALVGAGLQAATLGLAFGVPVALFMDWRLGR